MCLLSFPTNQPWSANTFLTSSSKWLSPYGARASVTRRSTNLQESACNLSSVCKAHIAKLGRCHTHQSPPVSHTSSPPCKDRCICSYIHSNEYSDSKNIPQQHHQSHPTLPLPALTLHTSSHIQAVTHLPTQHGSPITYRLALHNISLYWPRELLFLRRTHNQGSSSRRNSLREHAT
jgi:hypothetical protein